MENHDFFADIAMTQHPIGNEDKENPPREAVNKWFKESEEVFPYGSIRTPDEYTQEERYGKFLKDLEYQRKKYEPFMQNYTPEIRRAEVFELKDFEFRYAQDKEIFSQINDEGADWEKLLFLITEVLKENGRAIIKRF